MDFSTIFQIRTKRFWWMDVIFYFVISLLIATVLCYVIFMTKNNMQREDIKKETRALEAESKQLETESYVKSRFMSDSFGRDANMIKEYGIRLKEIQKRMRDIVVLLSQLQEEKIKISK